MSTPTIVSSSVASSSAASSSTRTTSNSKVCSRASPSADRIRSRFLHKIGIDSPPPNLVKRPSMTCSTLPALHLSNDLSPASGVGECILRLEPLKIALESDDDDSSLDSEDDSFKDGIHSDCDIIRNDRIHAGHHVVHKKRQRECSTTNELLTTTITLDRPLQDSSGHSLPSLIGSEGSEESYSMANTCILSASNNSNKKPRFLQGRDKKPRRKKKSVTIHKSVSVVPIPSRLEYSNKVRERIWTTAVEIQKNAARNTIEFCSESWKWQNVLEDEQMFVHQENGELVHPIHVHNALSHIQASDGGNNEEIQMNLSLISALVPPASAAIASRVEIKKK